MDGPLLMHQEDFVILKFLIVIGLTIFVLDLFVNYFEFLPYREVEFAEFQANCLYFSH